MFSRSKASRLVRKMMARGLLDTNVVRDYDNARPRAVYVRVGAQD